MSRLFPMPPGEGVSCLKTPGFVYFIQAEGGGLIKIGWATKPAVRVANMQMYCPIKLAILLHVTGDGAMERDLHKRFEASRRHGEWFEPTPDLLALVEEWRSSPPPAPIWPEKKPPLSLADRLQERLKTKRQERTEAMQPKYASLKRR